MANMFICRNLVENWIARGRVDVGRAERAMTLVGNVSTTISPNAFFVIGSNGHRYIVIVDRVKRTSTCSCPDSKNGNHCKHRIAVALYETSHLIEMRYAMSKKTV